MDLLAIVASSQQEPSIEETAVKIAEQAEWGVHDKDTITMQYDIDEGPHKFLADISRNWCEDNGWYTYRVGILACAGFAQATPKRIVFHEDGIKELPEALTTVYQFIAASIHFNELPATRMVVVANAYAKMGKSREDEIKLYMDLRESGNERFWKTPRITQGPLKPVGIPPTITKVTEIDPTTLLIEWNPNMNSDKTRPLFRYDLQYQSVPQEQEFGPVFWRNDRGSIIETNLANRVSGKANQYLVTNLWPDTLWLFRMRLATDEGNCEWGNSMGHKTSPADSMNIDHGVAPMSDVPTPQELAHASD